MLMILKRDIKSLNRSRPPGNFAVPKKYARGYQHEAKKPGRGDKLGARVKVEDQYLSLEAYSRRENLKFENIPENVESGEDTELVLHSFLERELGYVDAALVEIQRVHRLGRKKEGKSLPILARFPRFKDCQSMLPLGPRL